jgi:hypothetical protein
MLLRPDGGPMVDATEQEKVLYVTAALFIGGADTVGARDPHCSCSFAYQHACPDCVCHDNALLQHGRSS